MIMSLMVVVETHPEDVVDLRLDAPWPELQNLASTLNFEEMDSFEHGHVPYVLILLKFLEQWKETVILLPGFSFPSSLPSILLVRHCAYNILAWIPTYYERQKSI